MPELALIDPQDITVTPIFRWMDIENIPKSEEAGHLVKETREVVQVRFAGSNNYSPIFPVDAFYKREGNNVITYAERWSEQYRQFKEGNPQEANGTPLEMLRPYGITPEQLSLCRTMKVYSIEALNALEGPNLKNLGMASNKLKEIAKKYIEDRSGGAAAMSEIERLKAKIAELEARSTKVPEHEPTQEEMEVAPLEAMTDDELRHLIEDRTGTKPDGRLARASLLNLAKGL
jgi:hypothetical protein